VSAGGGKPFLATAPKFSTHPTNAHTKLPPSIMSLPPDSLLRRSLRARLLSEAAVLASLSPAQDLLAPPAASQATFHRTIYSTALLADSALTMQRA
jgi:hypothetical protein